MFPLPRDFFPQIHVILTIFRMSFKKLNISSTFHQAPSSGQRAWISDQIRDVCYLSSQFIYEHILKQQKVDKNAVQSKKQATIKQHTVK